MKTIIGFDSWTEGAQHFERLVPAFKKHGYRLVLVHVGSWGHDPMRPKEEMIGELCVRDISFYGDKTLGDILDTESPSGVLFLSTRSLIHMAFNRYAKNKNIPTCHIYHGLVTVQVGVEDESSYRINYMQHLRMLFKKAARNICKIIPTYSRSILETEHSYKDWIDLLDIILRRSTGYLNKTKPYVIDTQTDIGCVYTDADVRHMSRNYRIQPRDIHVVGNPDLLKFCLSEQDIGYGLKRKQYSNAIIYIDTALSEVGLVFSSTNDFIQHILRTRDELKLLGFKLIVKLHPAHYRSHVPHIISENGIDLCDDKSFINDLKKSTAAIVEPSTAAIIPALIGVPLLLAQYGKLSKQGYGHVLRTYPRSRSLTELSAMNSILLEEKQSLSVERTMEWIKINGGPMPAKDMPERAVKAFCKVIAARGLNLDRQQS